MLEKLSTNFNKKIEVHYQPIVKITKDNMKYIISEIVSFESLAQPKRDILLAKKIQFIQDEDKSFEFFNYMLDSVLNDYEEIIEKSKNKNISVSVNIDPYDIIKNEFNELILDLLSEKNINPNFLTIEILESFLEKKHRKIFVKNLKKIKKIGVGISMDDFPSFYSNKDRFNLLHNNELIKNLKIDGEFMDVILESKQAKKIFDKINRNNGNIIFEYIKDLHTFLKVFNVYGSQKNVLFQGNLFGEKNLLKNIEFESKKIIF